MLPVAFYSSTENPLSEESLFPMAQALEVSICFTDKNRRQISFGGNLHPSKLTLETESGPIFFHKEKSSKNLPIFELQHVRFSRVMQDFNKHRLGNSGVPIYQPRTYAASETSVKNAPTLRPFLYPIYIYNS